MRKFLAILFVLLLMVPTAARIMGLDLGMNINRLGLKFPQPYGRALLEKEYYRALDQYFNDSFPFRGPLILAKNWIDFNIFRTTEAGEVHIGQLGWLYSRGSITDYRLTDTDADVGMERLVLNLHAIEKIVTAADRHFLFVVAPSKTAVYPEFVGWSPDFITSGRSPYDQLLELLDRYPLKSHVPLDQVMKAAKRRQAQLYDRTHAFWNGLGASVAAESIHRRIREHLVSPLVLDYVSTTDGRIGDLSARIMGFASQIPDMSYQRLSGSGQPDLPSALLYGDGYRHNLMPYLLQMFNRVDVIQADRIPSIQHRENWLDYDCILLEIAQTGLGGLDIDLDRIYATLGTRSKFFRRTTLDLSRAVPLLHTSVHHRPDGMQIKSLGAGSVFELTDIPASNSDVFRVVKLTFTARQSDRMRFQYALPLREAAVKSIKPGDVDFYLPLPFQKTVSLRIFPGDKAGLIYLRSAEMIEFSDQPEMNIRPIDTMTAAKPSPARIESVSPPLEENTPETGDDLDENWIAVVSDWPDYDPVEKVWPDLSTEPEHRPVPGPATDSTGRLSTNSESRTEYRQVVVADADPVSGADGQGQRLIIVDAEIVLTQESEAASDYQQAADADAERPERSEVLPEYDGTEEVGPEFPDEPELPVEYEPTAEPEPISADESESLAYFDTVAEVEPELRNSPEMINDDDPVGESDFDFRRKPEILPEYEPDRSDSPDPLNEPVFRPDDGPPMEDNSGIFDPYESPPGPDQPVISDSDLSNESEILPAPNPKIDGEITPESDHRQPDAAAGPTTGNDRPTTQLSPVTETEKPDASPEPDVAAPKADTGRTSTSVKPDVLAKADSSTAVPPSVRLTEFEDGRIFQRRNRRADIVVSGTFAGAAGAIEARVVGAEDLEEVVPWTVVDDAPQNGIFVGVLSGVPQGGWYQLQARFSSDTTVSDAGSHRWGVGMLVACLGQSNMKEWFHTGDSFKAHALIRKYSDEGWTEPDTKGNGALAFGSRLVEHLGIPIGLLDYAVNGSGLRKEADWGTGYWEDTSPGSIYSQFIAGVSGIGGAVEFVIWFQGEADAARKTVTETEYRNSLTRFIQNQVRVDMTNASDREHLPFLIVMMTRRPRGHDEPHQAIRNAQKLVAENEAECYLAATTLDLRNRGKQHMHPEAYTAMGYRVAQTVLYALGEAQYYRGPTVTAVRQINDRRVDVSIDHRGGTSFKPASDISGWEILVDEEPRSIAQVRRRDNSTISIILEDPLTESATVRYLYGAMPDARRPVIDNSTLSLPLEPYESEISIANGP